MRIRRADCLCNTVQRTWRLSDEPIAPNGAGEPGLQTRAQTRCNIFLGYTSNLISSCLREVIRYLVKHKHVSVPVTTAGGIEEDFIKCLGKTYLGDFHLSGADLRNRGINRIGNLVVPNDNYCKFENWLNPILDTLLEEQRMSGKVWTPSSLIHRLGKEINNEESVYYWAYKVRFGRSSSCLPNFLNRRCCRLAQNVIPVLFPTITDGVIGDVVCMDSFKFRDSGLAVDIARGVRPLDKHSRTSITARMVVIGGGVCKHQIASALMIVSSASDWVLY